MNSLYYDRKEGQYYSHLRKDIVSLLRGRNSLKILEIGAAGAATLHYLKSEGIASEVMGYELREIPGSFQSSPEIDKFQFGNIESGNIDAMPGYFDIIICADVLEHLADPWSVLDKLKLYLKTGGEFIVSLPNVREWQVMKSLLFDARFSYQESGGILDKTHLRFFCKKDMISLLNRDGLSVIYSEPGFMNNQTRSPKRKFLNRLSFGLLQDFLTIQYLFVVRKNN